MKAYGIKYKVRERVYDTTIDAKNLDSAKKKIARKHGVDVNDIDIIEHNIIGYF